jgi:hypothetical protein
MNVLIRALKPHLLLDPLIEYLLATPPRPEELYITDSVDETARDIIKGHTGTARIRDYHSDVLYYLPPQPWDEFPMETLEDDCSNAILSASRSGAIFVMVSRPEALRTRFSKVSKSALLEEHVNYAIRLALAEAIVRSYGRGMVIRIPLLTKDPLVVSLVKMNELSEGDIDYRFSLGLEKEVAKIVADASTTGWYGQHNIDSGVERLSSLIPVKGKLGNKLYEYSLIPKGSMGPLPTKTITIWRDLRKAANG